MRWRAVALVAPTLAAALAAGCGGAAVRAAYADASLMAQSAARDAGGAADREAVRRAFAAARAHVAWGVVSGEPGTPAHYRAALLRAVALNDLAGAALLAHFWVPAPDDVPAFEAYLHVLAHAGRHAEAADLAWSAAVADPTERPRWMRAWYAALAADPQRFPALLEDVQPGAFVDELDPFTGQSSIILRLNRGGETVAVFKPHQRLRHQSFRGELASYRLCQLLRCTFTIPVNREIWIEEDTFRELTGTGPRDSLQFGSRRTLTFFEDANGDDRLYGVVKDWVPDFTRFPVEYTDVWRPLVQVGVTEDSLRALSIRTALEPFAARPRGFYRRILDRSDGMTAFELAQQLSELHVFDYLINNFDRYQPEWYGMNAHWQQGGFVSIDNGASFFLSDEFGDGTTRRRVERIEVFSRSMIDALRWMDPDAAYAILFPPNPWFEDEPERFAQFWERRAWLLDRVDALVDAHGEDAVYVFP